MSSSNWARNRSGARKVTYSPGGVLEGVKNYIVPQGTWGGDRGVRKGNRDTENASTPGTRTNQLEYLIFLTGREKWKFGKKKNRTR